MFEYVDSVANEIADSMESSATAMENDAASYESQATTDESNASQAEADASAAEAEASDAEAQASKAESSCPHTKIVTKHDRDEDGKRITWEEEVPDPAADRAAMAEARSLRAQAASLRAQAASLRAEAAALRAEAASLRGLASGLRATSANLRKMATNFRGAMQRTQEAVKGIKEDFEETTGDIRRFVSNLNIPSVQEIGDWAIGAANDALSVYGIDLSDGLNDELYNAISSGTMYIAETGAKVVTEIDNIACFGIDVFLGGNTEAKTAVHNWSGNLKDNYFNDSSAILATSYIVSGLDAIGINAKPTEIPYGSEAGTYVMGMASTSKEDGKIIDLAEAKKRAKLQFALYINSKEYLTSEEKAMYIKKYNMQIDKAKIISDDEFCEKFGIDKNSGIQALYNGPEDRAYIRESCSTNLTGTIIHEVGGHGIGDLTSSEFIIDEKTGKNVIYRGSVYYWDEDNESYAIDPETEEVYVKTTFTYAGKQYSGYVDTGEKGKYDYSKNMNWGGWITTEEHAMNEATTEYFTEKIFGNVLDGCSYNTNTEAINVVTDCMESYGICDGEKLLFETYTGKDKTKFKKMYNEISGNSHAYNDLLNAMGANDERGDKTQLKEEEFKFRKQCEYYSATI